MKLSSGSYNVKRLCHSMFFFFAFTILAISFQANKFGLCDPVLFEKFAMGTEAFVINRIALTSKFGSDAYGGFAGRIPELDKVKTAPVKLYRGKTRLSEYYNKFYDYLTLENFKPYYSNVCEQGNFLAWVYTSGLLSPGANFSNYRWIFSLISALILSLVIYEFYKIFGIGISAVILLCIIQLDWLVCSASHLFWFTGWFFLPFALNMMLLRKFATRYKLLIPALLGLNLILSFSKCLISGFEVIPTFLVLTTLPAFIYFFKNKYKPLIGAVIFLSISLGSLGGAMSSIVYQMAKIDNQKGIKGAGYDHIVSSYNRRSGSGNLVKPHMRQKVKDSHTASAMDIIKLYLPSKVMTVFNKSITAIMLLWLFIILSLTSFIVQFIIKLRNFSRNYWGLLFMTGASIFGPISMFVFFKSLSYLHPHLVPITWSLPFAFLVIALSYQFVYEFLKPIYIGLKVKVQRCTA